MLSLWLAHVLTSPIAVATNTARAIGAFLDRNQEAPWNRYCH
jgi:hypothetical protein